MQMFPEVFPMGAGKKRRFKIQVPHMYVLRKKAFPDMDIIVILLYTVL